MRQADHVEKHRAQYHPVADVSVTIAHTATGRKTQIIAKRCALHARLWDRLNDARKQAAEHISKCHLIVHGSPAKAIDLSKRLEPRGSAMPETAEHRYWLDYRAWLAQCLKDNVAPEPCLYVLAEGGTIRELARNSRARAAMARQLIKALDVMADLKGWK